MVPVTRTDHSWISGCVHGGGAPDSFRARGPYDGLNDMEFVRQAIKKNNRTAEGRSTLKRRSACTSACKATGLSEHSKIIVVQNCMHLC
jgi:hypothetical protein